MFLTSSGSAGEPDEFAASRKARGREAPQMATRTRSSPRQAAAHFNKRLIVAVPSSVMRCSTPGQVVVVAAAEERGPRFAGLSSCVATSEARASLQSLHLSCTARSRPSRPGCPLRLTRHHEPLRQIACRGRRALVDVLFKVGCLPARRALSRGHRRTARASLTFSELVSGDGARVVG